MLYATKSVTIILFLLTNLRRDNNKKFINVNYHLFSLKFTIGDLILIGLINRHYFFRKN